MHAVRVLTLTAAVAFASAPVAAVAETVNLSANLTPPTQRTLNGSKEKGQATLQVDLDKSQICYQIQATLQSRPVTALITRDSGQRPTFVARLAVPDKVTHATSGCAVLDPALVKSIADKPASYLVQIGTVEDSSEAVRGKLHR